MHVAVCSALTELVINDTNGQQIVQVGGLWVASYTRSKLSLLVAQWLERPTGVRKTMGSIPVGDSGFFVCPTLATC